MCYLCLYVGGLVGVLPVPVCRWTGRSALPVPVCW